MIRRFSLSQKSHLLVAPRPRWFGQLDFARVTSLNLSSLVPCCSVFGLLFCFGYLLSIVCVRRLLLADSSKSELSRSGLLSTWRPSSVLSGTRLLLSVFNAAIKSPSMYIDVIGNFWILIILWVLRVLKILKFKG